MEITRYLSHYQYEQVQTERCGLFNLTSGRFGSVSALSVYGQKRSPLIVLLDYFYQQSTMSISNLLLDGTASLYLTFLFDVILRIKSLFSFGILFPKITELSVLGLSLHSWPIFLLELDELLELFGQFLLVLIGIELLHSTKVYMVHRIIHLEAVLTVALIAVDRKIIVLEPKQLPEGALLGIGFMILALTIGYYLIRRSRMENENSDKKLENTK